MNIPFELLFHCRIIVDLNDLPKEQTVNIWKDVEDGKGRMHLLVTVSATTRGDTPSNLANWEEDLDKMKDEWTTAYVSSSTKVIVFCAFDEKMYAILC